VSSVDQNGKNYLANVVSTQTSSLRHTTHTEISQNPGDLWYFPAGIPHALQATDDDPDGAEFILVRSGIKVLFHWSC
jgi:uncharacterized RmlC-like cupin family protein